MATRKRRARGARAQVQIGRQQAPIGSAVYLALQIGKVQALIDREYKRRILPLLEQRQDAPIDGQIRAELTNIEHLVVRFLDEKVGPFLDIVARRIVGKNRSWSDSALKRTSERLHGVSTLSIASRSTVERFREYNTALIKSLAGRQLAELEYQLAAADSVGLSVEALSKQIQHSFGVHASKGRLLARDQVLKLNGQINRERQTSAGVTHYTWRTSGEERVRETHAALDGLVFSWDDPPEVSEDGRREHPGGDYQCRCTAEPVIPQF